MGDVSWMGWRIGERGENEVIEVIGKVWGIMWKRCEVGGLGEGVEGKGKGCGEKGRAGWV